MTFKFDQPFYGYPPIEAVVPVPASLAALQGTSGISPGFVATAEDPVWGPGCFVFARAGGAIPLLALCNLNSVWDSTNLTIQQNMVVTPNTGNTSLAQYVYAGNTALTTGQYGWFMEQGTFPISGTASVAAQTAVGVTAAGQIGASGAGKQIQGMQSVIAATQTVVSAAVGGFYSQSGGTTIQLRNTAGFFPGVYVSGTGVGASAICSFVDPIRSIIGVTVANSAAPSGNITATYNNGTIFYNVVQFNCPQMQGRIT